MRLHRRLRRLPRRLPRRACRAGAIRIFERVYPVRLARHARPTRRRCRDELIYVNHERGFALCSHAQPHAQPLLRAVRRSTEQVEDWPDERFWDELRAAPDRATRPKRSSPARRSRRASRRCAASSPSRCASAACSWPAMPRTSCRRPAPRASTSPRATCTTWPKRLIEFYRDKSSTPASTPIPPAPWRGCGRPSASPGG